MWYHIRREYIGKYPIIKPSVPKAVNSSVICRAEEGDIPRICVSDHVFKCITGVMGISEPSVCDIDRYFSENPCLYITDDIPYTPPNCLDFRSNNEHWFITPTKFIYLGRVSISKIFKQGIIELTDETEIKPFKTNKEFSIDDMKSNILTQLIRGDLK